LDVRGDAERREAKIPGSMHIPLQHLPERIVEVPSGPRQVVVQCASGYRSSIAASLLERHGVPEVADLVGGLNAWTASGLPVQ
jgi:rhodanese-related sulfurtransferase